MVDPNFEGYEEFHSSMLHKPNSIYLAIEKECAKMHDAKIEEEEDIFLAVTALITTIPNWSQVSIYKNIQISSLYLLLFLFLHSSGTSISHDQDLFM